MQIVFILKLQLWEIFIPFILTCVCSVTQLYSTLYDSMDCSPLGSCVHGIIPASILEWVAISSYRGSSRPRDPTHASCTGRRILYHWATWKAPFYQRNSSTPLNWNEIPKRIHPEILAIFTVVGVEIIFFVFSIIQVIYNILSLFL